ncbi:MAG: HPP family protein [Candidatus Nanopelagicales bacterium]
MSIPTHLPPQPIPESPDPSFSVRGRRQLLADFPYTAAGLHLPGRDGPAIFGWLALFTVWALAIPTVLAVWMQAPLVFPPLASSALMVCAQATRLNATPRAVILGHGSGVVAGLIVVAVMGLLDDGDSIVGLSPEHAAAGLVSVVLCVLAMALVGVAHAPALSTALTVGLGLVAGLDHVLVLLAGAIVLPYCIAPLHRLAGVPYPWWSPPLHH